MSIPYGSPPIPKPLPTDTVALQKMVLAQRQEMQVAKGDITELKDLARRLNTKYETEQKRLRQLQENIVLSNANAQNIVVQNEDLRQRLQHIEAHGIEQRHVHSVRVKPSSESIGVAVFGIATIFGMFVLMLYAVLNVSG